MREGDCVSLGLNDIGQWPWRMVNSPRPSSQTRVAFSLLPLWEDKIPACVAKKSPESIVMLATEWVPTELGTYQVALTTFSCSFVALQSHVAGFTLAFLWPFENLSSNVLNSKDDLR